MNYYRVYNSTLLFVFMPDLYYSLNDVSRESLPDTSSLSWVFWTGFLLCIVGLRGSMPTQRYYFT